jgi:hypothetical protein
VHVPAGSFPSCIQVLETTTLGDKPETKWYAPGVGPIKSKTPGEKSELIASTTAAAVVTQRAADIV